MIIIVCLDDRDGMLFAGRRQSKDSLLRENMLDLCHGKPLWMNPYSASQFPELPSNIRVSEDFLSLAGEGEYCFVENADISTMAHKAERFVIYRWNRHYPSDTQFPIHLFSSRWHQVSTSDFPGSSHERISREVYEV